MIAPPAPPPAPPGHPAAGPARSRRPLAGRLSTLAPLAALALTVLAGTGCQSMSMGSFGSYCIDAVPARRLPPAVLGRPKEDMIETSKARLRRTPSDVYELDAGDVLGVYIGGILGDREEPPPVNFPEDATIPPALGFPIPVREDGTISLPFLDPIDVRGLTVAQAEEKVERALLIAQITEDEFNGKIIVTLIRQREIRVLVIREEAGGVIRTSGSRTGGSAESNLKRGDGYNIDLKAGENDLLTALSETGGLPGLDARNEVVIYRGGGEGSARYDEAVAAFYRQPVPCGCRPPLPDPYGPGAVRIPLRFYPEFPPQFTEEDITLRDGDVVYIAARDREKYYTGGLLGGGEYLLPRDYDLNVLQAVGVAGGQVGAGGTGISGVNLGGGRGGGGGPFPPSRAIVVRQLPNGCGEITIRVDLTRALTDPRERLLIQPEDVIILQYTLAEEIANTAINLLPSLIIGRGLRR